MIEVLLNSRKMDWFISSTGELPGVLERIEKEFLSADDFIKDVQLDGVSLIMEGNLNLDAIPEEQRTGAQILNIQSCTMMQLTLDAIDGAAQYLAQLSAPVSQVAQQFSTGQFDKAPKNLSILMDGFNSLISLLASLDSNHPDEFQQIRTAGCSIREHLGNFRKLVQEMLRAQEHADNISLADILEYEIRPQLQIWTEILRMLRSKIGESSRE